MLNNLKIDYSLAYGQALGFARCQGNLMWDDDIDLFIGHGDTMHNAHCQEQIISFS